MPWYFLGRRALIGPSDLSSGVFGSPVHSNLFVIILVLWTGSSSAVTTDLGILALSGGFLHSSPFVLRSVDFLYVANSPITPVSMDSSDFPPEDVGYRCMGVPLCNS